MALSEKLDNVHRAIVQIHRELFDESPTPMKLQKLCYYAQGFAIAGGQELFPDDFQAWQHGPVVYDLYTRYKNYQWRQITEDVSGFEVPEYEHLVAVVSAFGRYDGAALSTMTHREAPWLETRQGIDETDGCDRVIPKELMGRFFTEKLRSHGQ